MDSIYTDDENLIQLEYKFFDSFPINFKTRRISKQHLLDSLENAKKARLEYKKNGGLRDMCSVMASHILEFEREIGA